MILPERREVILREHGSVVYIEQEDNDGRFCSVEIRKEDIVSVVKYLEEVRDNYLIEGEK